MLETYKTIPVPANTIHASDSLVPHQPGNPDPDEADVVALSPRSLMATNRFVCEVCNKGFQRDQNLQLHRRGHNLPWKLKQRNKNVVVKRKVYICPEPSCVHHDPSRALGDLTGIKKHFSRKHGEKKYKCDKCSKRYAVQSDWKAHSKICGTREYKCDCGTLFSRRDSFITHRAFCDALAEESSRAMAQQQNPLLFSTQNHNQTHHRIFHSNTQLKQEKQNSHLPPSSEAAPILQINPFFTASAQNLGHCQSPVHENPNVYNSNIFPNMLSSTPSYSSSSLMSATALLQKAAQIGVTMSTTNNTPRQSSSDVDNYSSSSYHHHVGALCANSITAGAPSHEGLIWHGFSSFENKTNAKVTGACMQLHSSSNSLPPSTASSSFAFDVDSFDAIFNAKIGNNNNGVQGQSVTMMSGLSNNNAAATGHRGNDQGLTRDFLGLRPFPREKNFTINMSGLDQMRFSSSSSYDQRQAQDQLQWQI